MPATAGVDPACHFGAAEVLESSQPIHGRRIDSQHRASRDLNPEQFRIVVEVTGFDGLDVVASQDEGFRRREDRRDASEGVVLPPRERGGDDTLPEQVWINRLDTEVFELERVQEREPAVIVAVTHHISLQVGDDRLCTIQAGPRPRPNVQHSQGVAAVKGTGLELAKRVAEDVQLLHGASLRH